MDPVLDYKVQNRKCPKMQYIGHYVCSGIELITIQKSFKLIINQLWT